MFLVLLVAGGVVAGVLVVRTARTGGDLQRLSGGTRVTLPAGDGKYLYAKAPVADPGEPPACEATGPGTVGFATMTSSQTLTENGVRWTAVARLHVSAAGRYTVTCPAGSDYAIGNSAFSVVGGIFGGIGAFFGLALAGLLAGGTIALVTLVRRSSDRRRRRAPAGYPQPPHR